MACHSFWFFYWDIQVDKYDICRRPTPVEAFPQGCWDENRTRAYRTAGRRTTIWVTPHSEMRFLSNFIASGAHSEAKMQKVNLSKWEILGKFLPVIHVGTLRKYRSPDVVLWFAIFIFLLGSSHNNRSVCSVCFPERVNALYLNLNFYFYLYLYLYLYLTWNRVPCLHHSVWEEISYFLQSWRLQSQIQWVSTAPCRSHTSWTKFFFISCTYKSTAQHSIVQYSTVGLVLLYTVQYSIAIRDLS